MPWINTQPMDQKIAFVTRALAAPRGGFAVLCREFLISRKTGYKWLRRYRAAQSLTALHERSRRPRHSPRRIASALEEQILQLRAPDGWGARKIAHWVAGFGGHGASDSLTARAGASDRSAHAGPESLRATLPQ